MASRRAARNTTTRKRTGSVTRSLRVTYAEADRVRRHLQAADADMLYAKDIRTILAIINDVYPKRDECSRRTCSRGSSPKPKSFWQLIGIGIGLVLVIGGLAVI